MVSWPPCMYRMYPRICISHTCVSCILPCIRLSLHRIAWHRIAWHRIVSCHMMHVCSPHRIHLHCHPYHHYVSSLSSHLPLHASSSSPHPLSLPVFPVRCNWWSLPLLVGGGGHISWKTPPPQYRFIKISQLSITCMYLPPSCASYIPLMCLPLTFLSHASYILHIGAIHEDFPRISRD